MRLLGIDYGFKRIGLAIAETEVGVITPRPPIAASGTLKVDAEHLAEYARREEAEAVVLGVPFDETSDGKMERICQTVANHLRDRGIVVHVVDESLSSVRADAELKKSGLKASQRRKLRDGEAAREILERFIHEAHG